MFYFLCLERVLYLPPSVQVFAQEYQKGAQKQQEHSKYHNTNDYINKQWETLSSCTNRKRPQN